MKFIADLHVHSRYSRATSPEMCPDGLWRWAQIKGISIIGTGDFTHPRYFAELREKLSAEEDGLFRLKKEYQAGKVPTSCRSDVKFMLQAEISSIYSKGGRTRKVHSIVLAPGLTEVEKLNRRLSAIGNLQSDGRPILGLDARVLLEIALEVSSEMVVIPAHVWTPHFSIFGAASGFDKLEECYEDLTPHIIALETGLSSDPPMNRRLSALDGLSLVSNSDAHSPANLGREANVFDTEASYPSIMKALKSGKGFEETIEFFPQEGKYHHDGHRNCGVSMTPEETRQHGFICPVCGGKLTVGVLHRVEDLADRQTPPESRFKYIVPLAEIIAETMQRGPRTKGVQGKYFGLVEKLGSEFHILLESPVEDVEKAGGREVAEAIRRMRQGNVMAVAGYDGKYGVISVTGLKAENESARQGEKTPVKNRRTRRTQQGLF